MRSIESSRNERRAVAVLSLGFGLVGIDRFLISTMYPTIARDLHLGYGDIGTITGVLALAWGLAALVMGDLSDRVGQLGDVGAGRLGDLPHRPVKKLAERKLRMRDRCERDQLRPDAIRLVRGAMDEEAEINERAEQTVRRRDIEVERLRHFGEPAPLLTAGRNEPQDAHGAQDALAAARCRGPTTGRTGFFLLHVKLPPS